MKRVLILVLLIPFLATATASGGSIPTVVTRVDAVPEDAVQLLDNPGFEEEHSLWALSGDSARTNVDSLTGEWSLWQGGADGWGMALAPFYLGRCVPGDIWVTFGHAIYTGVPIPDPGFDVTEGSLKNVHGVTVVQLWEWYEHDYTDGWVPVIIRVQGIFDVFGENLIGSVYIASSTNETITDFLYDDVGVWCVPALDYAVYLPALMNGSVP